MYSKYEFVHKLKVHKLYIHELNVRESIFDLNFTLNGFAHRNDQKIHFNFGEIHFCHLKVNCFGE
jgi:hypothetical protein